jgi:TPR repeat protein
MKRALALAFTISALGLAAAPASAQDDSEARFLGRTAAAPKLSVRTMPAAPPVHKLSIGPLSTPADDAIAAPSEAPVVDASLESLARRANGGDAEANYRLGLKHLAGDGVVRDFVEAFARIRLAAEAGHPRAISLFYTIGARLTAEEHGQAYLRTQQLRPTSRAAR